MDGAWPLREIVRLAQRPRLEGPGLDQWCAGQPAGAGRSSVSTWSRPAITRPGRLVVIAFRSQDPRRTCTSRMS
jgi:hypothetical protein